MLRSAKACALLCGSALASMGSLAQAADPPPQPLPKPAPPPAAETAPSTVQGIVVSGQAAASEQIDRRSYSVAKDLNATAGSVSDVLRDLPNVSVDLQGTVSIRGDANVTFLIDGKVAPQLNQGSISADTLRAMAARTVDRIEVMTSPSAEFTSVGTGGVINLVMKHGQTIQPSATVSATATGTGGALLLANGQVTAGRLSFSAEGGYHHDRRDSRNTSASVALGQGGASIASEDEEVQNGRGDVGYAGLRADFQATPKTSLGVQASANWQQLKTDGTSRLSDNGPLDGDGPELVRNSRIPFRYNNHGYDVGIRHAFAGDRHDLSIDYSSFRLNKHNPYILEEVVDPLAARPPYQKLVTDGRYDQNAVDAAYRAPVGGGRLVLGYRWQFNIVNSETNVFDGQSPATAAAVPSLADVFHHGETQQAVFGTFQRPFGPLTLLAGLRVETLEVKLRSPVLASFSTRATNVNPSLNAVYKLDANSKLTFGYSRRVNRPGAQQYNPFLDYIDPVYFRQGDPNIRSPKVDAFELTYDHGKQGLNYSLTGFYRHNVHTLTSIVLPMGPDTYVRRAANLADSQVTGVTGSVGGRLAKTLQYQVNATASYNDIDGRDLPNGYERKGWIYSGQANLNWTPTNADLFQLNLNVIGKALLPQGYTQAHEALNLGYRRQIGQRVYLTVTGEDLLGSLGKTVTVIDTPTLRQRQTTRYTSRTFTVGLSYAFGGAPGKAPPKPEVRYRGGLDVNS